MWNETIRLGICGSLLHEILLPQFEQLFSIPARTTKHWAKGRINDTSCTHAARYFIRHAPIRTDSTIPRGHFPKSVAPENMFFSDEIPFPAYPPNAIVGKLKLLPYPPRVILLVDGDHCSACLDSLTLVLPPLSAAPQYWDLHVVVVLLRSVVPSKVFDLTYTILTL